MSYSVDLQFTINEDFSNPQTVSESGKPTSMTLQGLQASQTYYTKAILKNDGVVEDESQMTSFQTLPAGTIVLNHYQTTRSGYDYEVVYLYSSTYAPSWATLSVNGSTFQGVFDSAQHAVSFLVTGLTPGTAYLDLVTLGDIYGETGSVQGSIVATVVNDIDITSVDTAFTTAEVNIDYIVDGGFYVGYVEWWLSTQDPSTDPAEGHEYFNNGAETVTISGLNEGTDYKFRASITLSDQTTTIVSNVVAASTDTDYSSKYFTIKNVSSGNNTIGIKASSQLYRRTVYFSTNNGGSWSSVQATTSGATITTLAPGGEVIVRHTGALGKQNDTARMYTQFTSTDNYEVFGNISSLTNGTNYKNKSTMPSYAFRSLFAGRLVAAHNLSFDSYTNASDHGCNGMFASSLITTPPKLPMTELSDSCYEGMFSRCESLITAPQLPATNLSPTCYKNMFYGCIALSTAPQLPSRTLSTSCYDGMFEGCTSLVSPPELPSTTLYTSCYEGMFRGCSSLGTTPELPSDTLAARSYWAMFNGCSSLTEGCNLKHVTSITKGYDGTTNIGSMSYMYANCTNLNVVYAPSIQAWTTGNNFGTLMWLDGVAASGTVYKPAELEIPKDTPNGVPEGWETQDY